ncbi:efflux RND transporter permease subunit [Brumicola pallidula]|uniref:Cation/multidrug efflux pump n=1 Tax=Brumicola pallidula DSM 14239 = ACAM 615 TaxID=1121922 RepID=K6ZXT3_9ALTE|nr:efflux RND transporter permease subunit [Glaciecola pallidula]GAC28125.1 cation/multidrug efflux pump [Glaciecola pallidula DSM 14239 = ACAM 615]
MIRYFVSHPTAANILMLAIIAVGLVALPSLNKETFPKIDLNQVQVTVAYPGASPSDVEEGICNPLEDATDGISFTKEQRCEARDNMGMLTMEMQENGDMRQFIDDIKSAVDGITELPENSEDPVIKELGRTEPVVTVAITAKNLSSPELKTLAEYYRDKLLNLPQVPIVTVSGFSTHQLNVLVKSDAMLKYDLSIQDIADLIKSQALELPVGVLESKDTSYQIRFENARKTAVELASLVIINTDKGGEIQLGDIATIEDQFENLEERVELDGKQAALLKVNKNTSDDAITIFDAVKKFVAQENARLPDGTKLTLTQDAASIVKDRLQLILKNAWQGLLLASFALFLFFNYRYTFWIALGLPVSFLGGLAVMSALGISINMISMVALLMAIGILMDDAIVLSESISHEYNQGKSPMEAAIAGTQKVARGVFSSFLTSALLFGSLLFMKGDMGQVMGVLPVVLLAVLTFSLLEAFLILPHHLRHSLAHSHEKKKPQWRTIFDANFLKLRDRFTSFARTAITYRYITVGIAFALFILSIGMLATGTIKFKAFPDLEGNRLEARILYPQGTPLAKTEALVEKLIAAARKTQDQFQENESAPLIRNIQVAYSENGDSSESGAHLATVNLDILDTELRHTSLVDFTPAWRENTGAIPGIISLQFKEPSFGPAGRAIEIQLSGNNLDELSKASYEIQNWLIGYDGVSNILDDLRPGKPQYKVKLLPGALAAGVDAKMVSAQLRSAYQGAKVNDIYKGREAYEINVKLDSSLEDALSDFDDMIIFSKTGQSIPLVSIATIEEYRDYARIGHVNHQRVVNIFGNIDSAKANTAEVLNDTKNRLFPELQKRYPDLKIYLKGEIESSAETNDSIFSGFFLALTGVFLLLSLQFKNYREPIVVMLNIPLALIGAIMGHYIMGLDFTMPSMIGFVSLAGVVVNDSILLVEFVKYRVKEGMVLHDAAGQAVHDRFRAIFLTSVTTIAGMAPLLLESSLQAQVLIPLVTSIVFGMLTSTMLVLLVLPAAYGIMEDIGFIELSNEEEGIQAEKIARLG